MNKTNKHCLNFCWLIAIFHLISMAPFIASHPPQILYHSFYLVVRILPLDFDPLMPPVPVPVPPPPPAAVAVEESLRSLSTASWERRSWSISDFRLLEEIEKIMLGAKQVNEHRTKQKEKEIKRNEQESSWKSIIGGAKGCAKILSYRIYRTSEMAAY